MNRKAKLADGGLDRERIFEPSVATDFLRVTNSWASYHPTLRKRPLSISICSVTMRLGDLYL